jgi:hypothetical protein
MPNYSLVLNNGLNGNGTNSGADLALNQKISFSFSLNDKSDRTPWLMNQVNLSWRDDCFDYLEPGSLAGILQQAISRTFLLVRSKTDASVFQDKILTKFRSLLFKLMLVTQQIAKNVE